MKRKYWVVAVVLLMIWCTACGKGTEQQIVEQLELGQRYLEEENYEEAMVAFTKVIEIDEKNVNAYLGKAKAYFHLEESEENLRNALEAYEKVVELDQANQQGYLGMADIYIRTGKYEDAIRILEKGYEITGDQELEDKLEEMREGTIKDSTGRYYKELEYDGEGRLEEWWEYTYDELGRKSSAAWYDGNGVGKGYIDVLYDENGNCIQGYSNWYVPLSKVTNEYDDEGKCIKSEIYNGESIVSYCTYEYDLNGLCVRENSYKENGEFESYYKYKYNSDGNWLFISLCSSDDTVIWYQTFEYEGEQLVKRNHYEPDFLRWYETYDYDVEGNLVSETHYDAEGNVTGRTIME